MGLTLLAVLVVLGVGGREAGPTVRAIASSAVGGPPLAVAVDVQSGRALVVKSAVHNVSVLDTHSGAVLGAMRSGSSPLALAVDAPAGRVFVAAYNPSRPNQPTALCCSGEASVSTLDLRRGRLLHSVPVGLPPLTLAVDAPRGRVFVTSCSEIDRTGRVSLIDARSGRLLRTIRVGPWPRAVAVDERTGQAFITLDDGSGMGRVGMLDRAGVRLLRTSAVNQAPGAVATDERTGRVFVLSQSSVGVVDARTGVLLRTVRMGRPLLDLAIDEQTGRAFVTLQATVRGTGGVSVLDATSGRLLRTSNVDLLPEAMTVDERHGLVFVVSQRIAEDGTPRGPGAVSVLDAASGRLLRTVPIGGIPNAVAVDERTEHLVVPVLTGAAPRPNEWWALWMPWLPSRASRLPAVPSGVTVLAVSR